MPYVVRRFWPLVFVALAALWLRTHELDRRPMHADEANQAVKAGELLETGRYAFDPHDHHGPTLYFAALPLAWMRGERTLAELSETTVRLVPAIFGTLAVVLLAVFANGARGRVEPGHSHSAIEDRNAGDVPWLAVTAAAFISVSPPAVYYSRYFVQETLLVTFTLATFACTRQWWRSAHPGWAIAAGASAGLAQATKASAPLFLVAALIAAAVALRLRPPTRMPPGESAPFRPWWRHIGLALAGASFVAALLYSSFGTNPHGIVDAIRAYTNAFERFGTDAPPTGHEKPWWYYLQLFGWKTNGGLLWHQAAFSVLALAGLLIAIGHMLRRRGIPPGGPSIAGDIPPTSDRGETLAIWSAVYSLIIMGAFSAFAYKTPWHAIHFVPGMALLAGVALAAIARLHTGKFVAAAFALVTIGTLYQQTARAAFLRPADWRNPYAYVHSSGDVLKFRALAESAMAQSPGLPIRVISQEYWPLPWYFRGLANVGYWSEVPADCDGAMVITSQATAETVAARLRGNYRQTFLGLRPGFVCILFIREP